MGGIFDQVDAEAGGGRGGRGMRGAANPRSFDVSKRRTIYVAVNRTAIPTPMVLYDFVDSTTSAGERPETTIAPQALYLMNNPFARRRTPATSPRGCWRKKKQAMSSAFARPIRWHGSESRTQPN